MIQYSLKLYEINFRISEIFTSVSLEDTILSKNLEIRNSYYIFGSVITQICIADLLKKLKIPLSVTAGYSCGELVCAYFDGALTLEETLQCAYIFNNELGNQEKVSYIISDFC